jgi:helicase
MPTPAEIHNRAEIYSMINSVESIELNKVLGESHTINPRIISELRASATLAFADFFKDDNLLQLQKSITLSEESKISTSISLFIKWDAYLNSLLEADITPSIDDLIFFCASGLFSRKNIEVRCLIRKEVVRKQVMKSLEATNNASDWLDQVRNLIGSALLSLVQQESHADVKNGSNLIQTLAIKQKEIESQWLEKSENSKRDALTLLGFYHLAQAIKRTSEFLLVGSIRSNDRVVSDFAPELNRLLLRAEEYFLSAGDLEKLLWLKAVAIIASLLRQDSIWVAGLGISERMDSLIADLAGEGREQPIFSLLPSQHDALREKLLDPAQIAVILQMPTSAGKTLLAEFTIVQTFEAYKKSTRVAYVTPTRALATQMRRILAEDLGPLGINVSAAGSAFEEDPYELSLLEDTDGVVVATPEKLDLLLRSKPEWAETLRLIVIDEAHLLKEKERGVGLELLLANIRREQPQTRLLLLTPFVENAKEIASWLGGKRGSSIHVQWRPTQVLVGVTTISGGSRNKAVSIEWRDPYRFHSQPADTHLQTNISNSEISSSAKKVVFLTKKFQNAGSILTLFSASPKEAEKTAQLIASERPSISEKIKTPALRLAIDLAKNDYGEGCALAQCLDKGVAFHHSSLSPILRYLVEDQIRSGIIKYVAATSTIAQGVNFPVATVLVHSVHKPYGGGNLTPSEFWNLAGRAGRVGLAEKGMVVFANQAHKSLWANYTEHLSEPIRSALLEALKEKNTTESLKEQYRKNPVLRPFFQYLQHAASKLTPQGALDYLDELLQGSLAGVQAETDEQVGNLRFLAQAYLVEISHKSAGLLKITDSTGLGSFSFDQLYATLRAEPALMKGPKSVLSQTEGMNSLINALQWLPELELAIGFGSGPMNVEAVARVVKGWVDGTSIQDLAKEFPGDTDDEKIRKAGTYVYGKVSQTISWGAHAYVKGWLMNVEDIDAVDPGERMLPSYIQYGVHSPEASVASLLGVPRLFAEGAATEFRDRNGSIEPSEALKMKEFLMTADSSAWKGIVEKSSRGRSVNPDDLRTIWRQMQGVK